MRRDPDALLELGLSVGIKPTIDAANDRVYESTGDPTPFLSRDTITDAAYSNVPNRNEADCSSENRIGAEGEDRHNGAPRV